MRYAPFEPPRRALQYSRHQPTSIVTRNQEPQRPWTFQLATRDRRSVPARKIVDRIEHQPRPETRFLANQLPALANSPPHDGAAAQIRPHRHDPGRRVPAPNPLVLAV